MNPSAQRIRSLFALNDPTNYYWENFRRFLQGHSYKDRAALLAQNEWTVDQSRAMLAIISGMSPMEWFNTPKEQRVLKLMMVANIRTHRPPNAPVDPMVAVRLNILGSCWDELSSRGKFTAWNVWGSGVAKLDPEGKIFALSKMKAWQPQSPHDTELKLQALVGTLDEVSGNMRQTDVPGLFNEYQEVLRAEVRRLQKHWPATGIESVQIWRQLQGYPDFLVGVPHPHPWMESMCVAHTGPMAKDFPPAVVFRQQHERIGPLSLARDIVSNASNPLDKPLAQALHRHFMGQDPQPAPEVQGLFALLEGSSGIVGTLLSMNAMANPPRFDVAGDVFEVAP